MSDALQAMQVATYTTWAAHQPLVDLVGGRIYDQHDGDTVYPHLLIDSVEASPLSARGDPRNVSGYLFASAWDKSQSWAEVNAIAQLAVTLLHGKTVPVPSLNMEVSFALELQEQVRDSTGLIRQIALRFRVFASDP